MEISYTNKELEALFAVYMEKEEQIKELPEILELKDYYSNIEDYYVDVKLRINNEEARLKGLLKIFADINFRTIDQRIKDVIPANVSIGVRYKGCDYTICYYEELAGDVIANSSLFVEKGICTIKKQ